MIQKLTCHFPKTSHSYEIEIHHGLLKLKNHHIQYLSSLASKFAIITDDHIASLYGKALKDCLNGLDVYVFTFPHGEQHKTRKTKEILEDEMFNHKLGRDTCVIAFGGGVVTDLAGYLAATYCRGVPLVMIPTSLLGMVDASIGGKTGVNVPYGKNMLGCIYQPKKVWIDPSLMTTLPKKEFVNGVVEMIKHGIISDDGFFDYLEEHAKKLLAFDSMSLEKVIFESCRIKNKIVEIDEKEEGIRHLLNFGHTVGHALEKLTNYTLSHGEAVAIGILVESYFSFKLGFLELHSFNRIRDIFIAYGLRLTLRNTARDEKVMQSVMLPIKFSVDEVLEAMTLDKKSINGKPRFVIINAIGSSLSFDGNYCTHVEESLIKEALEWMNLGDFIL